MKPPWLSSGLPVLCPSKSSMSLWPCAESFVPLLQFGLCSEASSLQPWGPLLPDSRNLNIFSQDSAQAPKEESSSVKLCGSSKVTQPGNPATALMGIPNCGGISPSPDSS